MQIARFHTVLEIGPYQILCERSQSQGRNSGCRVYEAVDRFHRRRVVLSECPRDWPAREILRSLEDNAQAFALLDHPSIERVYGFIRRDASVYLVTELVEGITLEEILRERKTMPWMMAMMMFRELLSGVAAAHGCGVVLGNLNPANISVPKFGPLKILKFGYGQAFGESVGSGGRDYLAPEQIEGQAVDERADIYALGVMLYEALAGRGPFAVYSADAQAPQTQFIPLPLSLLQPDTPKWLDDLLLAMIAPEPKNRVPSAQDALRSLDSGTSGKKLGRERPEKPGVRRDAVSFRNRANVSSRGKRFLRGLAARASVRAMAIGVMLAAELFYFRGAHVASLLESGFPARPSLSDSVDAMFAKLPRDSKATESSARRDPGEGSRSEIENRKTRAMPRQTPGSSPTAVAPKRPVSAPENQEEAPAYASARRPSSAALVGAPGEKEPEPGAKAGIPPNNTVAPTLSVQWEN